MDELPPRKTYNYPLGFHIAGQQVVFNNGAVHPATPQETALWNEVERLASLYADAAAGKHHRSEPPIPPATQDIEWERPTVA